MADALKDRFGPEVPVAIADMVVRAWAGFDRDAFVAHALDGFEDLDLMARGRKIAASLRAHLPESPPQAIGILVDSLGPPLERTEGQGMAPFLYLPHAFFVAENGLDDFDVSMRAQYEITQRFTAEFSIRPFLERYPAATLERLRSWANDPSPHVRRLVSEGTRPRLPWAPRLRAFQKDPRPVLELLELLKDDPSLYVRRSVANSLNDIGKDHPGVLVEVARRWMADATPERRWLVRHALRSAVKRGDPNALAVMGFGKATSVSVGKVIITPRRARVGGAVRIAFELASTARRRQAVLVDFCIHYVKAGGKVRPKVFKLKALDLAPGDTVALAKTVSLADMTTRRHYAGRHEVTVLVNGETRPLGAFHLE